MGQVLVHGASLSSGKIDKLRIGLHGLPERTIDRDTALSWMKDGHSFLPVVGGKPQSALQLVEVGEEATLFIRVDNEKQEADALPELPSA